MSYDNNKFYIGVGSRSASAEMLEEIQTLAYLLAKKKYTLLSGGSEGCEQAFEKGCDLARGQKFIFGLAGWHGRFQRKEVNGQYNSQLWNDAQAIAKMYHPAWDDLSPYVQKIMTVKSFVVLGGNLATRVKFLICWTPDGVTKNTSPRTGGTGQAIRLAKHNKIQVFNLQSKSAVDLGRLLKLY